MRVFAQRNMRRASVELYLSENYGNQIHTILPVLMQRRLHEPGIEEAPTLAIPLEAAQQLMQELWDQGFRPNNGAGSSAEADALKNHIKFAERVAYELLVAAKPPIIFNPEYATFDPTIKQGHIVND